MTSTSTHSLAPFVPRMALAWLAQNPNDEWKRIEGSLAFIDISGFTALTERLARRGKVGAEQLTDVLNLTFARLLDAAQGEGGDLIKWGGDAMLLLFDGPDHAARACRAAYLMREGLEQRSSRDRRGGEDRRQASERRRRGEREEDEDRRSSTTDRSQSRRERDGSRLHLSAGVHSGTITFCLVGDPGIHRELLLVGADVTRTVQMESTATTDEIVISPETARLIEPDAKGAAVGAGFLLDHLPAERGTPSLEAAPDADPTVLLSPDIRAHLLGGQSDPEHRRVAVGFVRFRGTDRLLQEQGPGAAAAALDAVVRTAQAAARERGVAILGSDLDADGGKILVSAGAPINRGRSDERIVRAALDIASAGTGLGMSVGLNSGAVFAGDVGPASRRTYTVMGDPVNLAARVMGHAGAGQVVATSSMLAHVSAPLAVDALAPFMVKGKSAPVDAAVILEWQEQLPWKGHAWAGAEGPARAHRPSEPLVGRDSTLARIGEAWNHATAGAGRTVRLTAGPGGGITSLLHAATAGHSVFGATADPYRTATAYSTVRALLASVLGLKAHDAADAGRELAELIATAAPGLVPWIPLIATVLDVPADTTSEVDALADEFRRPRLEASIVELLRALVAAPTFLVIDDAHLLDDASLGVVRAIEAASDTAPWLLLLGGRPTGPWLDPSTEVVALPALDETAARTLITAALGDRALTPTDTTAILRRGAGNPSFLKSLALAARSGQDVTGLPDSAEELVAAQVDALDPPVRRALRYASVLGMSFDNAELGALLGDGSTAHPRPPLPAEFISMDNGRFRFTQALVRDAAYEGLSFRVRARLHGRAAEYLAESAQDPSAISDLLSLHYAHANRPEPAWHFSLVAGDRARAKFAPAEAEVLYARALRSGRNLRSIGPIDRGNVYVKLARSQEAVGRLDSAVRSLREGRTRLRGDPLLTADAYATEASVLRQLGRFPQVMRAARSGIAALDGLADAEAEQLRSDLKMVIAGLLGWEGRVSEALDWARSAETDAAASGRPQSQAYVATTIHWCLLLLGTPDRSYGERALAWHRETGDRRHEAESLNNLALQDWQEGRGEKALESFRESAEVARAAGDEFTSTVTRANVGDVLVRLGRAEEAESLLRDVAHVQQALGAAGFEATTRRSLAIALAQLGRFAEAESILEAIQATQQELGEEDELTESRTAAAWTALLAGDPARALARCADAEARAREAEATYLLAPILRITGAALLDQGRVPEATTALTEALGRCVEARFERGFVLAELARAARAAGEEETARDWERQAETAWEEFGWTGSTRYPRGT